MKYWIFPLFLLSSVAATGQSNFSASLFSDSVDEPLALLEQPAELGIELPQDFLSYHRALGCDAQVFLTEDPIPAGNYEASQEIIATGVVQSGTVTMRAGVEVILDSDAGGQFEVKSGAVLEITMGACTL